MSAYDSVKNEMAEFTWCWGCEFFIETVYAGNYIWKDPGYYEGDNSFKETDVTYKEFLGSLGIPYGRSKGRHLIKDFIKL